MDDVAARLDALRLPDGFVVGVDGFMAAGKTTLATKLSDALGWRRVELDDFLEKGGHPRGYLETLRLTDLRAAWTSQRSERSPLIVAGACLREVLHTLSDSATAHVYAKCLSAKRNQWDDGDEIEEFESGGLRYIPPLSLSILEYHAKWKPHESADIVFEWLDHGLA